MRSILIKVIIPFLMSSLLASCAGRQPEPSRSDPNNSAAKTSGRGNVLAIRMVDESAGWALSELGILRTVDAGATWVDVAPPGIKINQNTRSFFLDADTGWVLVSGEAAGSSKGVLYRTVDGGRTWDQTPVPFGGVQMHFASAEGKTIGWVLNTMGAAMGSSPVEVYSSEDGGQSWSLIAKGDGPQNERPTPGALPYAGVKQGISFRPDGQVGWVAMEERHLNRVGLYRSEDKGRTWKKQELTIPDSQRDHSVTVFPPSFTGIDEGTMLVRFHGAQGGYAIYATTDGGRSWSPGATVQSKEPILVSFVDAHTGWAVEAGVEKAQLFTTENAGKTWQKVTTISDLSGVKYLHFTNAKRGWMLANQQGSVVLLTTRDGGRTWSEP